MTQDELRVLFDYDAATGNLIWKHREDAPKEVNSRCAGKPAGGTDDLGYIRVCVNGKHDRAHRIIWTMCNGAIPAGWQVDHINRDRSDNRLANLRLATISQNRMNSHKAVRDIPKGVCRFRNKFKAEIQAGKKRKHLGVFDTAEEAAEVYGLAAEMLHGEFACLSK